MKFRPVLHNPVIKLRPWQVEALQLIRRRQGGFFECHRRSGKSWFLSYLVMQRLLLPTPESEACLVIAPELKQSWQIHRNNIITLKKRFEKTYRVRLPLKVLTQEHKLLTPYGEACFASLQRSADYLRGSRWRLCCLDEIGEIKASFDSLFSALLPALSDRLLSELIMAGTPPSSFGIFRQALRAAEAMGLPIYRLPLSKSNLLNVKQVERLRATSESLFLREFELQYSSEHSLDKFVVQAVLQNIVQQTGPSQGSIFEADRPICGLDLGLADKTILSHRDGPCLKGQFDVLDSTDYGKGVDKTDLLPRIAKRCLRYCINQGVPELAYDAAGAYGPLISSALEREKAASPRGQVVELVPVFGGNPAPDRTCRCMRAWLFRQMSTWLTDSHSWLKAYDDDTSMYDFLLEELDAMETTNYSPYDVLNKVRLSKKLHRSPDALDSFSYTFANRELREQGDLREILSPQEYWRKIIGVST